MRTSAATSSSRIAERGRATRPVWIDGGLAAADDPVVLAAESASSGCFTTARWTGIRVRFLARHVDRLCGDARRLGLGALAPDAVGEALTRLGEAAFGDAEGVVRLRALPGAESRARLLGHPRPLGHEAETWRAVIAPFPHAGAPAPGGAKRWLRPLYARATDFADAAGVEEAVLCDGVGRLVEGSRTNLVCVGSDGVATLPPRERGAVAGVALAVLAERTALAARDWPRAALGSLRELIAVNAVRGARPIVELDGRPVGDGAPGPVARTLAEALDAEK